MAGGLQQHLDEFGICRCEQVTDREAIRVEVQDERTGRYRHKEVPVCGRCWGVL